MSIKNELCFIGEGTHAHRIKVTDAALARMAKGLPVYGNAACGHQGNIKLAGDDTPLCRQCCPRHHYRMASAGPLREAWATLQKVKQKKML